MEEAPISKRVQLLIKNMVDNRASNWEKTRKINDSGPKKVEDLRRELEEKARKEEELRLTSEREEQYYADPYGRYSDKRRGGDRRGGNSSVYQKKGDQPHYRKEEGGDRGRGKEKYTALTGKGAAVPRESQSNQGKYIKKGLSFNEPIEEIKPLTDNEMGKKLIANFHSYFRKGETFEVEEVAKSVEEAKAPTPE